MAGAEGLAACFALLWLADRRRATVPGSPLLAKNSPQDCFLNAQTLSGSSPYQKKSRTSATLSFWQGQKDLPRASHSYGSPTVAVQQYPAHLSSLKTVHRTVFLTLRPSRVQVLIEKKSRTSATLSFWQGQKDLNPRHVVLETTALPTELYPYIKLVGHQGLEPRTDRL